MIKLFRYFFPKKLTRDQHDLLKLITMIGFMLTSDTFKDDPHAIDMNTALMAIWERRTAGIPELYLPEQG